MLYGLLQRGKPLLSQFLTLKGSVLFNQGVKGCSCYHITLSVNLKLIICCFVQCLPVLSMQQPKSRGPQKLDCSIGWSSVVVTHNCLKLFIHISCTGKKIQKLSTIQCVAKLTSCAAICWGLQAKPILVSLPKSKHEEK